MFDIAASVDRWQHDGHEVALVRLVDVRGMSSRWPGAVAAVCGGEQVGTLVAGAIDRVLPALADTPGPHTVPITDDDAARSGLACGGVIDLLVHPAAAIPATGWARLRAGQPVTLVTDIDGDTPGRTVVRDDDRIAVTSTRIEVDDGVRQLIAAYRPVTRVVVIGDGLIAASIGRIAGGLGWECRASTAAQESAWLAAALGPADGLVVLSHDDAVDVPVLATALRSAVGYIGALGSRRTQARRAAGLRAAGLDEADLTRIHGPAGLDLGAARPEEIALAVVAELLAVLRRAPATSLSARDGPIHRVTPD
ncbi:MAG: XdhC family protein [Mycobacteriales bacterium]|nr:MAG: hypothetical protein DLM56_10675 [Pseudonocardiales bacterium]